MDVFAPRQRSEIMRRVTSKNTRPELLVRKLIHAAGYRYRLHAADVPGRPDVVIRSHKKAIFINGCFWHAHSCPAGVLPKANRAYWKSKQSRNAIRDLKTRRVLRKSGWHVLTIWECQLKNLKTLANRLERFLSRS